jgi:small multidrug resistance pump
MALRGYLETLLSKEATLSSAERNSYYCRRSWAPLSRHPSVIKGRSCSCYAINECVFMSWLYLFIAIVAEVIATSALKATDGFTRLLPSAIVVVGYAAAFYFLALTLRYIPIGVAYAIWSGVGVILVSLAGVILYKQVVDAPMAIGIALIIAGVLVMNLYSKSVVH